MHMGSGNLGNLSSSFLTSSSFEHEGTALSSGLWCPPCCVLPDYWSSAFNPVVSRRNTPQLGRGEDPEFTLWLIGHAGRVLVIELKKKKNGTSPHV